MSKTPIYDTLTSAAMLRVLEMAKRYDLDNDKNLDSEGWKAIRRVQQYINPLEAQLKHELKQLARKMSA